MKTLYELMEMPLTFKGTLQGNLVFSNEYFTAELEWNKEVDIVEHPSVLLLYDLAYKYDINLYLTHDNTKLKSDKK